MLKIHTLSRMLQTNSQIKSQAFSHKVNHSLLTKAISIKVVKIRKITITRVITNMVTKIQARIGKDKTKTTIQEAKWAITTDKTINNKTTHISNMTTKTTIIRIKIISMIQITMAIIIKISRITTTATTKCKVTIHSINPTTIIIKTWV